MSINAKLEQSADVAARNSSYMVSPYFAQSTLSLSVACVRHLHCKQYKCPCIYENRVWPYETNYELVQAIVSCHVAMFIRWNSTQCFLKSWALSLTITTAKCSKSEVKAMTIITEQRIWFEVLKLTHRFNGKLMQVST